MNLLRCYNSEKKRGSVQISNVVVVLLFLVGVAQCALPLSKPCGDVECQGLEYCRPIDHTCQSCSNICDKDSNNFDEDRCVSDCQDYIHNERYLSLQNSTVLELQRVEMEEKYKKLESDVLILKYIVAVCIAVILIVVAVLVAFLVYFWKLLHPGDEPSSPEEKKKKGSVKSATSNNVELPTIYNNRYGVTTPTPETSPTSAVSNSPADTNMSAYTTSTTVPPYHNPANNSGSRTRTVSDASISLALRASPDTVTTTLTSAASTLAANNEYKRNIGIGHSVNNVNKTPVPTSNRFRREPSESTMPENCAYDNLSMSPQHNIPYAHHV